MNYNEALLEWGARRLENSYHGVRDLVIDRATVKVEMEFEEGYACCGGSDPDCYCSFAESPSCQVRITGQRVDLGKTKKNNFRVDISHYDFDFVTILKEIIDAGGGTVTAPREESKVIHTRQCGYKGCGYNPCINRKVKI